MIKIGWVFASKTAHIIDEETQRSKCNMVSLNRDAARDIDSGAIISETEAIESLDEVDDMKLRLCSHCEDKGGLQ